MAFEVYRKNYKKHFRNLRGKRRCKRRMRRCAVLILEADVASRSNDLLLLSRKAMGADITQKPNSSTQDREGHWTWVGSKLTCRQMDLLFI